MNGESQVSINLYLIIIAQFCGRLRDYNYKHMA